MARQIASYILHMSNGNRDTNFHIIPEVDFIRVIARGWSGDGSAMAEETVIFNEAPPARRGVAVERVARKLKSEEKGEELGDCSICLDELISREKRKVIKIPCGHVYHESCIFKWLQNYNSCPLCRKPLPREEDSN